MKKLSDLAARLESPAYSLLRIVAGFMFSMHGMQKLFGWLGARTQPAVGTQAWVGGIIELTCGLLIVLGLVTRPAALLAAGTMAVAYFQFHWKLKLGGNQWSPLVNRGELAALYCFVFLFITARGAGAWSLDGLLRGRTGWSRGRLGSALASGHGHR